MDENMWSLLKCIFRSMGFSVNMSYHSRDAHEFLKANDDDHQAIVAICLHGSVVKITQLSIISWPTFASKLSTNHGLGKFQTMVPQVHISFRVRDCWQDASTQVSCFAFFVVKGLGCVVWGVSFCQERLVYIYIYTSQEIEVWLAFAENSKGARDFSHYCKPSSPRGGEFAGFSISLRMIILHT